MSARWLNPRFRHSSCRVFILVLAVGSTAAGFAPEDEEARRQELIAKLSSNISKVDHTIEVTKDLIEHSPEAPYLPDLYLRLAELHVERSRYVYARLMEQETGNDGVLPAEKALEVRISKKLAIEIYDRILSEYPEYEHADEVRYFRAHEYRELGDWDTMLSQYRELIETHPKSPWALEARVILGDFYFDKGELDTAEGFYKAVLELPESHIHDMARYKLGWIRINQEKFKEALQLFEDAVTSKRHRRRAATGDGHVLDVKREALLALVWPFTEVKKAHEAPAYFRRLVDSKPLYVTVLARLANRYFIKTQYREAALLYREIVTYSGNVDENIEYVQRIYESLKNLAERDPRRINNADADVRAIAENLARFENQLSISQAEKTQLASDFEVRARDLSTRAHLAAQKNGERSTAKRAAEAYDSYLNVFPDAAQAPVMRVNRAEALMQAKQYVEAGSEYERAARPLQNGPKRRELIYSAVLAYYKAIEEDTAQRDKHPTRPSLLDPLALLRAREGLKQLGSFYVRTWPRDSHVAKVKFNVARMYFQQGEYEQASELFAAYVETYPTSSDAGTAGDLALDSLYRIEKYEEMAELAKKMVANPRLRDEGFKKRAAHIAEAAGKRKVELALLKATTGDFSQAMLDEWEKNKGTRAGEDVLWAAFVKLKNENDIEGVFDFGARLAGAYPKSSRLAEVYAVSGNLALRAADFERAAGAFEQLYARRPDDSQAPQLLESAARIRLMLGELDQAAQDLRSVARSGSSEGKTSADEMLLQLYTDAQDWSGLGKAAHAALSRNSKSAAAHLALGVALSSAGKTSEARRELDRAVRFSGKDAASRRVRARASYELGALLHSQFDTLQFTDAAGAESVLTKKLELLNAAEKAYISAIGAGDPEWVVASLHAAARLYADFATFLTGVPLPASMSVKEQADYKRAIAQQAAPYAQRAKETLAACAQKAGQLRVLTATSRACIAGDLETVASESKRRRTAPALNEAERTELSHLHEQLAQQPENTTALTQLGRQLIRFGDYHLARLVLQKAVEAKSSDATLYNLLGVALWNVGDTAAAQDAFVHASKAHLREAYANLAALCHTYGLEEQAKQWLHQVDDPATLQLTEPDLHPAVSAMLSNGGGS